MKKAKRKKSTPKGPLWKGPEVDGITQSLLSTFLCCRERFRLLVIDGLRTKDSFRHAIEYGQMWHLCEEALAEGVSWEDRLTDYCVGLTQKYRMDGEAINKWYNVCKLQFPLYVKYWKKHPDVKSRKPLCQEETFNVPYKLPSGRTVRLRGKWDSIDWIGSKTKGGIYLQENKTKGDIKEEQLKLQVGSGFDLQTMIYLIALHEEIKSCLDIWADRLSGISSVGRVLGVRYNVIRRPLSGGKHSIRPHKPTKKNPSGESLKEYYARLESLIAEEPSWYFMRWKIEVTPADLERFKREFLNPILEQLCDWWEWVAIGHGEEAFREPNSIHWRTPYGIWNVLIQGGMGELDEYMYSGSTLWLEKTQSLFGELE